MSHQAADEYARLRPLLELIARFESRGEYTIIFGGRLVPELTGMTIRQVYSLMDQMLDEQRQRRGRAISTAVGKYQIIRATLRMLVDRMRLNIDQDRFTPILQDRMAVELLNIRGLQRFLEGRLSLEDFGVNIAKEWASMPMPHGGSYYGGDGVNKALIDYRTFIETVRLIRP